ncbi:hypothetical protein HanRHA438_Chr05g0214351 [Helianthus annuus]|nr:hypothetical protein HanRHA438_Chr05g0214351 [Helianthus annuus]
MIIGRVCLIPTLYSVMKTYLIPGLKLVGYLSGNYQSGIEYTRGFRVCLWVSDFRHIQRVLTSKNRCMLSIILSVATFNNIDKVVGFYRQIKLNFKINTN